MIELNEFVTRALRDILRDVNDAQPFAEEVGAVISPIDGNYRARVEPVEFDIEVATAEAHEEKAVSESSLFLWAWGANAERGEDQFGRPDPL